MTTRDASNGEQRVPYEQNAGPEGGGITSTRLLGWVTSLGQGMCEIDTTGCVKLEPLPIPVSSPSSLWDRRTWQLAQSQQWS
jgi:hypothetical protein